MRENSAVVRVMSQQAQVVQLVLASVERRRAQRIRRVS
jgi:hypothetical protein